MTQSGQRILSCAAGIAALGLAIPAAAATQGRLGASSRGSIQISISLRAPARADGLSDFTLGRATPARDVCFRGAPHGYAVAASGSGPNGALTLSNGTDQITYSVACRPLSGDTSTAAPMARAPAAISAAGAAAGAAACDDVSGVRRFSIAFDPGAAERLEAEPYTGALMLTLVPE